MTRLLVVDWDSFYIRGFEANKETMKAMQARGDEPLLNYDWGHRESRFFLEMAWSFRAAAFLRSGIDLPGTTGEQHKFWQQFDISPDADIFVAESNSAAINPEVTGGYGFTDVTEVWLYDAHHDCGYGIGKDPEDIVDEGLYECGNWMLFYWGNDARLYVRYPQWSEWKTREDRMQLPRREVNRQTASPTNGPKGQIDRVFICRSGAWVPPWVDDEFVQFVHACPGGDLFGVNDDVYDPMTPRPFDIEEAQAYVEATKLITDVDALADKLGEG
jgi:hypothetical protein